MLSKKYSSLSPEMTADHENGAVEELRYLSKDSKASRQESNCSEAHGAEPTIEPKCPRMVAGPSPRT